MNIYGKPLFLSPRQHELRLKIFASSHTIETISELSGVSYNAMSRWITGLNEPKYHMYKAVLDAVELLKKTPRIKLKHERETIYNMRESGMSFPQISKKYNCAYASIYSAYWAYKKELNKTCTVDID